MSKIIIKRSNKKIEIVDYKGKFEDMNKLLNLKALVYTPFELGVCDLTVAFNPYHKTDGSKPNFFIYDRYDIINGDVIIFKSVYDKKKDFYHIIDLTEKDIENIKDYMRREKYV